MKQMTYMEALRKDVEFVVFVYQNMDYEFLFDDDITVDWRKEISFDYGEIQEFILPIAQKQKKITFVGLGDLKQLTSRKFRELCGKVIRKSKKELCFVLDSLNVLEPTLDYAYHVSYMSVYSQYKPKKIHQEVQKIKEMYLLSNQDLKQSINHAEVVAGCVNHARDMGNLPANYMTPDDFVNHAKFVAELDGVTIEILDNEALKEMHAGAILGVNRGSFHGAYLIKMTYFNGGNQDITALVGKGLTFDSGGYNVKTGSHMLGMKYDMCGGANVLASFEAIAKLKLKVNVMAVIAVTENRIGANAYTCDEVLTSLSKKTIEIKNTDAEGRLILCDAITYAQQNKASSIIDMATLTGACVAALGNRYTGAFTNDQTYLNKFIESTRAVEENVWQLPLDQEFEKQVCDCDVADMTNCVIGANAGASLAAAFLKQFVFEDTKWIHLDIAGTSDLASDTESTCKGATGVMVESIVHWMTTNQSSL